MNNFKTMRDELEKQKGKDNRRLRKYRKVGIKLKSQRRIHDHIKKKEGELQQVRECEKMVFEKLNWRWVGDGKDLFDKYVKFTKQDIDKDTENVVRHSWLWLISRLGDEVRGEKRVVYMRSPRIGRITGDKK